MADEIVRAWLEKVAEDLKTVRNCLYGPEPIVATATYHCQQAAEKLVKAVLVHARVHPPKTHDIEKLLKLIDPTHPLADRLRPIAALTPYAWLFRYPAMDPMDATIGEPSVDQVAAWHDQIAGLKTDFESWMQELPSSAK